MINLQGCFHHIRYFAKKSLVPGVLFLLCLAPSQISGQPCDRLQDSLNLVSFYNSTGGPLYWLKKWDLSQPLDSFAGVSLTPQGCVSIIDLSGNNLFGVIPSTIGNLNHLVNLKLDDNQLTGSIPATIGNLTNLKKINLFKNKLNGAIPSTIGSLLNLESLFLGDNQLTQSIPVEIGNLTKLTGLNLYKNSLNGSIPSSIGNLINLKTLDLNTNQLTGSLPATFVSLKNLETLLLLGNQLNGDIPTWIDGLSALIVLDLGYNQFTGSIPTTIGNMTTLKNLNLTNNYLIGSIPSELGNLVDATFVCLAHNNLTGNIPVSLGNWTKIDELHLENNQLSGCIPEVLQIICPAASLVDISSNPELSTQSWTEFCQNGTGICSATCSTEVTSINDSVPGSLRYAIDCANNNPGPDTIRFAIPGPGIKIINLKSSLPAIRDDSTIIDGTSQPGGVILDGSLSTDQYDSGLLRGDSCKGLQIFGLIIRNAPGNGVKLENCSGVKFGAPGKGNTLYNNGRLDQQPFDFANFSGTYSSNITLYYCTNSIIQNNKIGITETNAKATVTTAFGISIAGSNILVGGNISKGEGNFIGNCHFGLTPYSIEPGYPVSSDILIYGNNIGTGVNGTEQFGNVSGLDVFNNILNSRIGNSADQANIIRFNDQGLGVAGPGTPGNTYMSFNQNMFSCNGNGAFIATDSAHTHPLNILTATEARVSGIANPGDLIEIYRSVYNSCPFSSCEGSVFLGSTQSNNKGEWIYYGTIPTGTDITASATDLSNKWTFGFAACVTACRTTVTSTADSGPGSFRDAISCANYSLGPDTIRFQIPGAGPHIINPKTPLPPITGDSLVIDATTQPGWAPGKVILDGTGQTGKMPALHVNRWMDTLSGFELYGLTIRNFDDPGLSLFECRNIVIGAPNKGNVFYANSLNPTQYAHHVVLQECENGRFQNNIVGLREDFSIPPGNANLSGFAGELRNFLVGGDRSANEGNVIGNCYIGINLWDDPNNFTAEDIQVFGNDIGRTPGGADVGNSDYSVSVVANGPVQIGDGTVGHSNRIKYNEWGLFAGPSSMVTISRNQFSCNHFSVNAPAQPLQILSADIKKITGTASKNSKIEVYSHQPCGNTACQGETFLGTVLTDNAGNWILPAPFVSTPNIGDTIVATTTLNNQTSGFSCPGIVLCPSDSIPISYTGSTSLCLGDSLVLEGPVNVGYLYQWTKDGLAISGANSPTFVVKSSGEYKLDITPDGCPASSSNAIDIVVNTPPISTVTFNGLVTFCEGDSLILNGSTGINYYYQWKNNGVDISGANDSIYIVKSSGNYSLIVTQNGCSDTSTVVQVVVNSQPDAIITAAGDTTFCTGGSVVLNGPVGSNLAYQWKNNGTDIVGANGPSYTATLSGSYTLVVTQSNCAATSTGVLVTVKALPSASIIPDDPVATLCAGDSLILYGSTAPNYSYQWQKDGIDIVGANNPVYAVTSSGNYWLVVALNSCSDTSTVVQVVVNSLPDAIITAAGDTTFCTGGSVVLNGPVGSNLAYQWKNNGTDIVGANGPSYTATLSGNYTLVVTQSNCPATSTGVLVTVNAPPNATIIPGDPMTNLCAGDSLILYGSTAANYSYQWQKDGIDIVGANNPVYTVTSSGNYTLGVTQSGCMASSTAINVIVNPIPVVSVLDIMPSTCGEKNGAITLSVADTAGLTTFLWNTGLTDEFLENIPAGIYTVTVTNNNSCDKILSVTVPLSQFVPINSAEDHYTLKYYESSLVLKVTENDQIDDLTNWTLSVIKGPGFATADTLPDGGINYVLLSSGSSGLDSLLYSVCYLDCANQCDSAWCFIEIQSAEDVIDMHDPKMPNAFSPGNDGKNDVFDPLEYFIQKDPSIIAEQVILTIVREWGEPVYKANPYLPWDGRINGKPVPQGTYFFNLRLGSSKSKPVFMPLTLLRRE